MWIKYFPRRVKLVGLCHQGQGSLPAHLKVGFNSMIVYLYISLITPTVVSIFRTMFRVGIVRLANFTLLNMTYVTMVTSVFVSVLL